jgi:hypothetical protein
MSAHHNLPGTLARPGNSADDVRLLRTFDGFLAQVIAQAPRNLKECLQAFVALGILRVGEPEALLEHTFREVPVLERLSGGHGRQHEG